jgi:hypothetical protein
MCAIFSHSSSCFGHHQRLELCLTVCLGTSVPFDVLMSGLVGCCAQSPDLPQPGLAQTHVLHACIERGELGSGLGGLGEGGDFLILFAAGAGVWWQLSDQVELGEWAKPLIRGLRNLPIIYSQCRVGLMTSWGEMCRTNVFVPYRVQCADCAVIFVVDC